MYFNHSWSPDSSKIAFMSSRDINNETTTEIYIIDSNGENLTRLTDNGGSFSWSLR